MKRFLKAFAPPGVFIVPVVPFVIAVAVMPTKPDIAQGKKAVSFRSEDGVEWYSADLIFGMMTYYGSDLSWPVATTSLKQNPK